jgi:hypothetical protein
MLTSNQIKTYIAFGDRFAKRVQKLRKYRPRRMGYYHSIGLIISPVFVCRMDI